MGERGGRAAKRTFDVIGALSGLVLMTPVMLGVAVAVRTTMGSPVTFRQTRPGLGGTPFDLIKFRTMIAPRQGEDMLASDGARLTPLGRFLRSTSLDELPTLWNVLRGEMSLVGPRPLLMSYLERYTPEQARRHQVKPGITGLAQVSGRNALSWEEKFRLDVWYVDNWSIGLDLVILLRTLRSVVRREGIAHPGEATSKEFMGSPPS